MFGCTRPQGLGDCNYKNGDRYEGEWVNGLRHGKGIVRFEEGGYYHGDVRADCILYKLLHSR